MTDENHVQYVIGFAFNITMNQVVLIEKDHPEWQAGKLNGVGGKIEGVEKASDAMAREFEEEAGIETDPDKWERFARMRGIDTDGWSWEVAVFRTVLSEDLFRRARTMTSEEIVKLFLPIDPQDPVIHNLRWLVPLARDHNRPGRVVADYEGVDHAKDAARQDREHHE